MSAGSQAGNEGASGGGRKALIAILVVLVTFGAGIMTPIALGLWIFDEASAQITELPVVGPELKVIESLACSGAGKAVSDVIAGAVKKSAGLFGAVFHVFAPIIDPITGLVGDLISTPLQLFADVLPGGAGQLAQSGANVVSSTSHNLLTLAQKGTKLVGSAVSALQDLRDLACFRKKVLDTIHNEGIDKVVKSTFLCANYPKDDAYLPAEQPGYNCLQGAGPQDNPNEPPAWLIPIYQAAASRYNVPWQVLAAINWNDTEYGGNDIWQVADPNNHGEQGWIPFDSNEWKQYGVDAGGLPPPFTEADTQAGKCPVPQDDSGKAIDLGTGGTIQGMVALTAAQKAKLSGATTGVATDYTPSAGGVNGAAGSGAYAPVYDSGWGIARLGSAGGGTSDELAWLGVVVKITDTKTGKSVVAPVLDDGPGGAPLSGQPRIIDMLPPIATALSGGLGQNPVVKITPIGYLPHAAAVPYGNGQKGSAQATSSGGSDAATPDINYTAALEPDGQTDNCDPVDAIFTLAKYLHNHGASGQVWQAALNATTAATGTDAAATGPINQRILQIAEQQYQQYGGKPDPPVCSVYLTAVAGVTCSIITGEWCAAFASWVTKQAGQPMMPNGIGSASTSALYSWAVAQHILVQTPQPGEIALYSTAHTDIVSKVNGPGRYAYSTIDGNWGNLLGESDPHPPNTPAALSGFIDLALLPNQQGAGATAAGASGGGLDAQAATTYAKTTDATVLGFSVFNPSGSQLASYHGNVQNNGRSMTKAMLLVAYLRTHATGSLSSEATSKLTLMIEQSDNPSANWVYSQVSNADVLNVAHDAGMTGFSLNTSDPLYHLGESQVTATDFARFFSKIDTMMPASRRSFGMGLLGDISDVGTPGMAGVYQAGVSQGTIYSKSGWDAETDGLFTFNQTARITVSGQTYDVSVVSKSRSQQDGEQIVQTVFQKLFSGASTSTASAPTTAGTSSSSGSFGSTGSIGSIAAATTTGQSSLLNPDQQQFAAQMASDTGLNSMVVDAWVLSEESGAAADTRAAANNNDWLNIGYTDTATFGSSDSIWRNPVSGGNATSGWLHGQNTIPGYGTASAGVQAILRTVGQPPAAQISALQHSGWASGGYTSLPAVYASVSGGNASAVNYGGSVMISDLPALPADWATPGILHITGLKVADAAKPTAAQCKGGGPVSELTPIWQAAGQMFDVPWEVIGGITQEQTNFGCNLSTSKAGGVGWAQFTPAIWKSWGVATGGGHTATANPMDARDAIFAMARYLKINCPKDDCSSMAALKTAISAYNHAGWYVTQVLQYAQAFGAITFGGTSLAEVVGGETYQAIQSRDHSIDRGLCPNATTYGECIETLYQQIVTGSPSASNNGNGGGSTTSTTNTGPTDPGTCGTSKNAILDVSDVPELGLGAQTGGGMSLNAARPGINIVNRQTYGRQIAIDATVAAVQAFQQCDTNYQGAESKIQIDDWGAGAVSPKFALNPDPHETHKTGGDNDLYVDGITTYNGASYNRIEAEQLAALLLRAGAVQISFADPQVASFFTANRTAELRQSSNLPHEDPDWRDAPVVVKAADGDHFEVTWYTNSPTKVPADIHTYLQQSSTAGAAGGSTDSLTSSPFGGPYSALVGTSSTGFTFPLPKAATVSPSAWTQSQGVDISAPGDTAEYAVGSGTIVMHGVQGFGPSTPVLHLDTSIDGQNYVYYGYAGPKNQLAVGKHVSAGQIISSVGPGSVGLSSNPHLEIGFCDAGGTPVPGTASSILTSLQAAYH